MTTHENAVTIHRRACNLCEAICGLEIHLNEQNEILTIKGDQNDPLSQGHICPKAVALQDLYHDKDRLKQPIKKTADGWQSITWEEAFDTVVSKIKVLQNKFGKDTIAMYSGNPSVHNSGTLLTGPAFFKAIGSKYRFSATSADQLPHHFVSWAMFGHQMTLPVPDVDRTDYFLIMGANPLVSNGSMMTAPAIGHRMKNIQKRGGKIVVIDPKNTETAKHADMHIPILPGADIYFLIGILKEIVENQKLDNLFDTSRQEQFLEYIKAISFEQIAQKTQIRAEQIKQIAKELQNAKSAVVYGRMGLSTQAFGALCQWCINLINIFTGNIDRPGGAMFTEPAFSLYTAAKKGFNPFGRYHSTVRHLPEFEGELPVACMAEELEAANGPKMLITVAGNPVLSIPNGPKLEKALETLDYYVAIDIYINKTTRHADMILPPTHGLETDHYDVVFHQLAVRNTAKYSQALYPKSESQRHDWEIFEELKNRLQSSEGESLAKPQNPKHKVDYMLQNGKYAGQISLAKLLEKPSGIDLGPLTTCLASKIYNESGRVVLFPELLLKDMHRLQPHLQQNILTHKNNLMLIGRRSLRSNNSWMHNSQRLVKGRDRCTLQLHPDTAQKLGFTDGQMLKVSSRIGAVVAPLELSSDMMPNVASLPHGYGHGKAGVNLSVASKVAGPSINDLSDELLIDELTGNAAFSGVPIELTAV